MLGRCVCIYVCMCVCVFALALSVMGNVVCVRARACVRVYENGQGGRCQGSECEVPLQLPALSGANMVRGHPTHHTEHARHTL